MSFQYLSRQQINDEKWDNCIQTAPKGTVYGYTWYLDSVSTNWAGIVYRNYEAIMPLPNNQKMGIRSIYPPVFAQQLGIFTQDKVNHALFQIFWEQISIKNFHKIRLPFHAHSTDAIEPLKIEPVYKIWDFNNYLLSLNLPYTELRQKYHQNTRRNVKKSLSFDFRLKKDIKPQIALDLFARYKGKELNHSPSFYEAMKQMMQHALKRNIGEIWGVFLEEELVCAGFFVKSHQKIYNLFPVNTDKGRETRALFYLIDQVIQENAESNLSLDFEGSMVEGVARFYKGFGSEAETYWHIEQYRMSWLMKKSFEIYRSLRS